MTRVDPRVVSDAVIKAYLATMELAEVNIDLSVRNMSVEHRDETLNRLVLIQRGIQRLIEAIEQADSAVESDGCAS